LDRRFSGKTALLILDADRKRFRVEGDGQVLKDLPLKGLFNQVLPFAEYADLI